MAVRANTKDGDWKFGRGLADYIKDADEIEQNLRTRILSFKNDWFLDVDANIDWLTLLGSRNKQDEIKREVERVALTTAGVVRITLLELTVTNREASVQLSVVTIFDTLLNIELGISE